MGTNIKFVVAVVGLLVGTTAFGAVVTPPTLAVLGSSCPAVDTDGITTFLVPANTTSGVMINSMLIKYDTIRKMPVSSTALHDLMSALKTVTRSAEPFTPAAPSCPSFSTPTKQNNCSTGISMTDAQKVKASPRYTWDRGHLTPANPMRFSEDALNKTFICVNIAPQDSWTNQIPWMTLEVRSEVKLRETNGYVMTGVCSENNLVDGPTTYKGFNIPKCFWKLICYKDKTTKEVKVVGFIGDNTIVNFKDAVAQAAKNATTLLPRSQSEILSLLTKPQVVSEGWTEAAVYLTGGRQAVQDDLPTPAECIAAKTIAAETLEEWQKFVK